ncbi:glycosyl hydrolase family 28 protein [Anaerosporobacter sp.]|uniref:glycosyl hydrolase family 28 protein n=1 Tax=Anaerosporobacter sp. TaxID=1872529 RepID=UPI00286F0164|nr:glycosyl hydrolase family 28 protein [Anaerosporobacter sp.]
MQNKKNKVENIVIMLLSIAILISVGLIVYSKTSANEKNTVASKLVLYEGPKSLQDATEEDLVSGSEESRDFTLKHCVDTRITVDGEECYVYDTNVNHTRQWVSNYLPPISRTPITYFDFEGRADIVITVPEKDIESVQISPLSYGIKPKVNKKEHTVSFSITTPDTYTIQFNNSPDRAVHIFANPMEQDIPDFNDENVVYVGPGEWDIESIALESGQTLYLAGGAVVHGTINGNFVNNVTVCGRGIIDGSKYEGWKGGTAYIPLKFDYCKNIVLKDVIVLNSNAWVCQAYNSENGVIEGIKIISPRPNGDGITLQSCKNFEVKNCFVRSWDDSLVVKNYSENSENITFSNMQLWTDFAQSMEVGYETNKGNRENASITDVTFENICVLNNFHKPVVSVHNADDAIVSNIAFRNIIVENAQMGSGDGSEMPYLIDLHIAQSSNWSATRERGHIKDIVIENVNVLSGKNAPSRIKGFDDTHTIDGVTIKNLVVLGKQIKDFSEGQFEIDANSTKNLVIE